jgi:hypothetical protein
MDSAAPTKLKSLDILLLRGDLMAIIAELKDENGKTLSVFTALAKIFKTGSRGYYANGKTEIDGKRYQVQIQLVEIGSKPKEAEG